MSVCAAALPSTAQSSDPPRLAFASPGRPSSQCDACKAARKAGGSHTKCECGNKTKKGAIEMLLNPCQCQFGGPCLCCRPRNGGSKTDVEGGACCNSKAKGVPCSVQEECPQPSCCDAGPSSSSSVSPAPPASSCCGGGGSKGKAPTIPKPASATIPDASLLALLSSARASAPPPDLPEADCSCGDECSCNGCSAHPLAASPQTTRQGSSDDCPTKCSTCVGCAVGLTAPECGIEAVDAWMRTEKAPSTPADSSRKRRAEEPLEGLRPPPPAPYARLPPMLGAPPDPAHLAAFHASHFQDPDKRAYFAAHLADSLASAYAAPPPTMPQPLQPVTEEQYGALLQGESEEQWQARFGVNYLTPSDVNYFDAQRAIREGESHSCHHIFVYADCSLRWTHRAEGGRRKGTGRRDECCGGTGGTQGQGNGGSEERSLGSERDGTLMYS